MYDDKEAVKEAVNEFVLRIMDDSALDMKHFRNCFRLFLQTMEVSFQIQKESKNGKIFHVTEPMYFTVIQVLRIKKGPVK